MLGSSIVRLENCLVFIPTEHFEKWFSTLKSDCYPPYCSKSRRCRDHEVSNRLREDDDGGIRLRRLRDHGEESLRLQGKW